MNYFGPILDLWLGSECATILMKVLKEKLQQKIGIAFLWSPIKLSPKLKELIPSQK